jgi:hypothetical protein
LFSRMWSCLDKNPPPLVFVSLAGVSSWIAMITARHFYSGKGWGLLFSVWRNAV